MSADAASGPTQDQLEILEYNFSKVNKHPDPTTLLLIAAEAGLSEEETQEEERQTPQGAGRKRLEFHLCFFLSNIHALHDSHPSCIQSFLKVHLF